MLLRDRLVQPHTDALTFLVSLVNQGLTAWPSKDFNHCKGNYMKPVKISWAQEDLNVDVLGFCAKKGDAGRSSITVCSHFRYYASSAAHDCPVDCAGAKVAIHVVRAYGDRDYLLVENL